MNFIKKWAIKRALKKKKTPNDDLDLLILEELKEAKKNNTMREKLLKLRMVQQIKTAQLDEMRQDIEGSDEEEPEAAGNMEDMIGQAIIGKLLGGGLPQTPQAPQEAEGGESFGGLEAKAAAAGMTREQIDAVKKEIFK